MTGLVSEMTEAVATARLCDPERISADIRLGSVDRRGGRSEPVSGGGPSDPTAAAVLAAYVVADGDDGPGRWARPVVETLKPHERRDLDRLGVAALDWCLAVSALGNVVTSHDRPSGWTACTDLAGAIVRGGAKSPLQAAVDLEVVGLDSLVRRAAYAVDRVDRIRRRHSAHVPTERDQRASLTGCRGHARIGILDRSRSNGTGLLCQWCYRQVRLLADFDEPVVLQRDPANWPSEAMTRAHNDGRGVLVERERRAWLIERRAALSLTSELQACNSHDASVQQCASETRST